MAPRAGEKGSGLRFRPWNLLLLVPLWILFTPLYNRHDPELFGMPFFYWFQFVGIAIGVTCTSLVYFKTKSEPAPPAGGEAADVDELDEGSGR
ncbi:hypothetical protein BAY61_31270 [Prauserella marina]|uniref:Uncharacterized protein n=1 Tax=Prauserella marina TaxID=530584 RepID=A0A222VXT1_9PSEU|nr:DUF3311 domain-containing protein [Prauserella marina]ASR38739.1 hypothetical protein BAY61_31270 [Prauserella marina]PWV82089.1 uncharacterized protein DUF3311 [Prauserella marina]SDD19167.1 Protein of unknown function [Prauserella marina]